MTFRLLVLTLIPALGLAGVAAAFSLHQSDFAQAADRAVEAVEALDDAIRLQEAAADEEATTRALITSSEVGLALADTSRLLGFDVARQSTWSRRQVREAMAGVDDRRLVGQHQRVEAARQRFEVDRSSGAALSAELEAFSRVATAHAEAALDEVERRASRISDTELAAHIESLGEIQEAVSIAREQTRGLLAAVGEPAAVGQLVELEARYERAVQELDALLRDGASAAWDDVRRSPSNLAFERELDVALSAGGASQLATDLDRMGQVFRSGLDRVEQHVVVLDQVSDQVAAVARETHRSARAQSLTVQLATAGLLVLTAVALVVSARSIGRPLRRLALQTRAVDDGHFDVEVAADRGPEEVAVVAAAFTTVVENLRGLEAQATALAEGRMDDPSLARALPGQLGRDLQASVERISQSIAEREELQDRLAHEATHDSLTGLPNRTGAVMLIHQALARVQRSGERLALLFVDLDGFKHVNDHLGHSGGDEVLCVAAERIRAAVRLGDPVCRLGGDEFVVVVEPADDVHHAVALAERVVQVISEPLVVQGRGVRVGASVGVALAEDGSTQVAQLLREADLAVYRAKDAGRGRVEVFDAHLREQVHHQAEVEEELARALVADELVLEYQPVVATRSGRLDGFEALVRWERPGHGRVPPDEFIPVAERTSLITDVDRWVLRRACGQLASWSQLHPDLASTHVAVNLSGRHVVSPSVVDDVRSALDEAGLAPDRLVVEVTETVLLADLVTAGEHLQQLRRLGVRVALDDYGTGYTSVTHLRHLPVDVLKIDRGFVSGVEGDEDGAIVRLLVETGRTLGFDLVAEGVETERQLGALRALACDHVQGYLIARPIPAAQVPAWASAHTPAAIT